jgi:hypothetical protein
MHPKTLIPSLLAAVVLVLAGCGGDSGVPADAGSGDETTGPSLASSEDGGSLLPGTGDIPVISERTYTSGTAHATVTGFFSASGSVALNLPASLTSGDQTWLQYGNSGAPELNIGVTSNQYDVGVTIGQGTYTVTAGGTDCKNEFNVEPTRLSGKFSCPGATGYDKATGTMGPVDIEVTFDAGS